MGRHRLHAESKTGNPLAMSSRPRASSEAARKRMQSTKRRDTLPELVLRQKLHALGLRYRVDAKPLPESRRKADIVFRRAKVAVFVDGCFWHGCPEHASWPRANANFWSNKIEANRARDADTNCGLEEQGWLVIRIWEHQDLEEASKDIHFRVRNRLADGVSSCS